MNLAQRLRELRGERALTLKGLAMATGMSVSYLSDIERGRATPTLETIDSIAGGFGMSVIDFLTGVDFTGEQTVAGLPSGLRELANDEHYHDQLTDEWLDTLAKVQFRGKRPQTKLEWLELYLYLKRLLDS